MGARDKMLTLLVVITFWMSRGCHAACIVRLDVSNASLAFTGSSSASIMPGAFDVQAKNPDIPFSLVGVLYTRLDGADSCPTTQAGWTEAASRLVMTSAPSPYHYKPFEVYPELLQLAVMGVPLNISSLAFNITMTGAAGGAAGSNFAVDAVITDGYAFSDTAMTGGPQLQRFAAERSRTTATANISVTKQGTSSYLYITIPDFNVSWVGKTEGVVGGRPWNGSLAFSLHGPVKLSGLLSCPRDCGNFGRCIAVNSTAVNSTLAGQYACECECGWSINPSSGKCEIPAGTCPVYGSDSSTRSLSLIASNATTNASSSDSCSGGNSIMSQSGACPSGYGFDVFTKTCSKCEADWSGPGCKMCTTDAACKARLNKGNAVCNTGLLYNERSSEKNYACTLNDKNIAALIGPVLPLTCKTAGSDAGGKQTGSSALAVDSSSLMNNQATCAISMRLVGMPVGTFAQCIATGCHFSTSSPSIVCDGVACDCPKGCPPSYLKTFRDVSGQVTLNCDTTGQDCTIVVGTLKMNIGASCEASECLDTNGPKLVSAEQLQQSAPPIAPPLVAAIPLLLLVIGGIACGAALIHFQAYLRSGSSGGGVVYGSSSGGGKDALGKAGGAMQHVRSGSNGSDTITAVPTALVAAAAATAAGMPGGSVLGVHGPGYRQISVLTFSDVTADVKVARTWRDVLSLKALQWQQQQQPAHQQLGMSVGIGLDKGLAPAGFLKGGVPSDMEKGILSDSVEDSATPSSSGLPAEPAAITNADVAALPGPAAAAATARASSSGGSSSADSDGRWRPVLRGVSGSVASGQVLGVMGPSGGGKSTLLLKLCGSLGAGGRVSDWRSSGLVCLDGVVAPPSLLSAVTALVPQDDTLMRSLTVEECIRYSAALRLDPSLPAAVVSARVEDVMARLGLLHIRRSTVLSGTGVSGVSGGERRRVAIAMELVIDPQVLVLDEPLSGLDSFTALQLMKTLQAVAASGRVVALSLHQPSPAIFASLDSAMLLAAGLMVYSGPPAAAAAALDRLGCPVPDGITVAEHMLHVVSDPESLEVVVEAALQRQTTQRAMLGQHGQQQQQQHARNGSIDGNGPDQASWSLLDGKGAVKGARSSSSGALKSFKNAAATFSPRPSASGQARVALGLPDQKRPFARQIGVLFWRGLLDMLRNPLLTAFHAVGGLILGVLVGIIFFQVKNDTSGAQNRVGAIFFALCLLAFTSVTSVDLVQAESGAAGREMQRKYYSPVAYAVTKIVLDGLLLRALPAVLFALPFYFLMGLNPAALQFFVFLLSLIGFSAAVGALALGFASALDSPGKTILVMNLVLLLGVLFGGFLANKGSIPVWLRWISWLSVFRYAWEALVINELTGTDLFLSAPGVSLSLPVQGEVFLEIIGVKTELFMVDISVLVAIYVLACVFVIFVLYYRNKTHRH